MQVTAKLNIEQVIQQLQQLQSKGENLRPLMAQIANQLQNTTEEAFEGQTSPFGQPWQPLNAATLKHKKGKPLYEDGRLQDTTAVTSDENSATVGVNATSKGYPYPAVHQFGSDKKNIPARSFLPFSKREAIPDHVKTSILQLIEEHLTNI